MLERRASPQNYTKKVDGDIEAKLVKLCCCEPPEGFAKWSVRLLADKMLELNYNDSIGKINSEVENGNFILKHSVGNLPQDSEIDVPLNYADYYYLEALKRKIDIEKIL